MGNLVPGIAIISHRKRERFVAWEPIFEIEDMLVHYCSAVVADAKHLGAWRVGRGFQARFGLQHQIEDLIDSASILLVIARHPGDLDVVKSIRNVRARFGRIFGYVFDSYFEEGYGPAARDYDHLFVTGAPDSEYVRRVLNVPSSVLRQGIDTVRWHSDRRDRCIDVVGFGRIPDSYHRALQARFHDPASPFLYLHSPLGTRRGPEVRTERPMFFQLLWRCKISLAFHMFVEPVGKRPRSMMVTSRWLEALASGCAVAGRRPLGEMAEDMLNWPESTVELAEDPLFAVQQIEDLLHDTAALDRRRAINLAEVRRRHDVRWRLSDMLAVMDLEVPETLRNDLSSL